MYKKLSRQDELDITFNIAQGISKYEISKQYGITYNRIEKIIKKPLNKAYVRERIKAVINTSFRVFGKIDKQFERLVNHTMEQSIKECDKDKPSLSNLLYAMNSFSERYEKLSKLALENKKLDIEYKKLELESLKIKSQKLDSDSEITEKSILETFIDKMECMATPGLDKPTIVEDLTNNEDTITNVEDTNNNNEDNKNNNN